VPAYTRQKMNIANSWTSEGDGSISEAKTTGSHEEAEDEAETSPLI
jgi:hypothetical protein